MGASRLDCLTISLFEVLEDQGYSVESSEGQKSEKTSER